MFISFEGGEGSGKTTHITWLSQQLNARNIPHILTREPGGTPLSEALRNLVVRGDDNDCLPLTEMLVFLAARYEHVERVIKPALARGDYVLCDRFHDSSRVYQGMARGLGAEYYNQLHRLTVGSLTPDLTILLDISPEIGLKRAAARRDIDTRFEALDVSFHHTLRNGFLQLSREEPHRIAVVDAAQPIIDIQDRLWRKLTSYCDVE